MKVGREGQYFFWLWLNVEIKSFYVLDTRHGVLAWVGVRNKIFYLSWMLGSKISTCD
jgi:hypothetical protein